MPGIRRWSEYLLRRRVHFYETDCAGIVHFSCFFKYLEEAEHALWRATGLSIVPVEGGVGFPRVHAAFDYHRPLRFEDEFDVLLRVAAIGEKSMRYECLITKDGVRIASGSTTMACVVKTPDGLKAVPFPDDIIARFEVARATPTGA